MLFGRYKKNPIKMVDKKAEKWTYATCGYCSVGCSIEIGTNAEGKVVGSRGVGGADVNRGKLCVKGIFEHELFESSGRGDKPLIRQSIQQAYQETDWDEAANKIRESSKLMAEMRLR